MQIGEEARTSCDDGSTEEVLEAVWVQLCIYYALRIQDDLVDGDIPVSFHLIGANFFFVEALRCFIKLLPGTEHVMAFHSLLNETSLAAVNIEQRSRSCSKDLSEMETAYQNLASALMYAIYILLHRRKQGAEYAVLRQCLSRIHMIEQIIDDLTDIQGDLDHGRFSLAVQLLLAHRDIHEDALQNVSHYLSDAIRTNNDFEHVLRYSQEVLLLSKGCTNARYSRLIHELCSGLENRLVQIGDALERKRAARFRTIWEEVRTGRLILPS